METYVDQPTNEHFRAKFDGLSLKMWSGIKLLKITKTSPYSNTMTLTFDP